MQSDNEQTIYRLGQGRLVPAKRRFVEEFPLKLTVNEQELATLVTSRTSPTDKAIHLSREAGITLIDSLRGEKMEVYTHPQQLEVSGSQGRIPGISGVILAGGESRRMGSDKSLLPMGSARFIDLSFRCLDALFEEVIIVTNNPGLYQHLPCRKVPDLYVGHGALAGIHSGVHHARAERSFVVACDMPFLSPEVIRHICSRTREADVVIPRTEGGLEPLHALYRKSCLPAIEAVLDAGDRKIRHFFPAVKVSEIGQSELEKLDAEARFSHNINTPEEYFALCEGIKADAASGALDRDPGARTAEASGPIWVGHTLYRRRRSRGRNL